MSVRAGPILLASSEAFHSGATARRKMMMSMPSRTSRIGMVIHPTRRKKFDTMSSMMTSRCARSSATRMRITLPSMVRVTPAPEIVSESGGGAAVAVPVLRRDENSRFPPASRMSYW
ncbi:hypothetical protein ACVWZ6_004707 [Bradyrhizobium sp. GM6.1]